MTADDSHGWPAEWLVGGHPALDFVNTVSDTYRTREQDALLDLAGFWRFAAAAGLTEPLPAPTPLSGGTDDAFAALLALREAAYAVLSALAEGEEAPASAAARLSASIGAAIARSTLDPSLPSRWRPAHGPEAAADMAALAFHALLTGEDLSRLKRCGRCSWLFLDRGRGRGRKWCDMRTCGNRAKAEQYRSGRRRI